MKLRASWQEGPSSRSGQTIYITSVPYTVNKATLVERIADVALSRKLPHLTDVKDLSTDDVRIALELKRDADPKMVMAYLFKHTPLQSNFPVNLTCLIPTEQAGVGKPERLELKEILWHFLHFRLDVVRNRLKFELEALNKRIHILEGFETIFDALDEILKIVRKSEGKADAAEKIMKRFELDAEQTDAILELKLYRLARLEILVIQQELADKLSLTWTTFARAGNPNNKLIPAWTAHNTQQRPTMVLDDEPKLVNDPLRESRVVIAELRGKYLQTT